MNKFTERRGTVLLEIIVSIAILGLLAVPVSSALLTAARINSAGNDMLLARLTVSSAAETLMAYGVEYGIDKIDPAEVTLTASGSEESYWVVTITSRRYDSISITTNIRGMGVRSP